MNPPLRSRCAISVVLLASALFVGSATAADPGYWLYFGTYTGGKSKGIYVSHMDRGGHLTAPQLASIANNPSFLATDPHHRFLYAANETDQFRGQKSGAVTAYAIDAATGRLTRLNQEASQGAGPAHVAIDATGHMVVAANYNGGSETAFPVNADGSLAPASSSIQNHGSSVNHDRQAGPHAHCVAFDPTNHYALVCDLGLDEVLVFKIDPSTATLTPNTPAFAKVPAGSGPRHVAFRPDGQFAYVINELGCSLTTFAFDASQGRLREIETISTLPAGEAKKSTYSTAEVCVHPSGRFLYGSNRGHNSIVVFAIDAKTGRLTPVEHVSSGGAIPRHFALDPEGRFLVAANQDTDNIVVFAIDPATGRLTPTEDSVSVDQPVCALFVPAK